MKLSFLSLILPACLSAGLLMAQPGALDPSFGTGGIVLTQIPGTTNDIANAVALQPDGKIIVGGGSGAHYSFTLVRYNQHGAIDSGFGTGGTVTTVFGSPYTFSNIYSIAVQPDGKIVAAGYVGDGMINYLAVARYNSNGTPDLSFNQTGLYVNQELSNCRGRTVLLQPDGKIVVTGTSTVPAGFDVFTIVRFNPDGTLDNSFNASGVLTTLVGTQVAAYSAALQPDGNILVAGSTFNNQGYEVFAMMRCTTDGLLDHAFNGNGKLMTAIGNTAVIYGIAVEADGKIVAAGFSKSTAVPYALSLVRYNSDGTPDTGFGANGQVFNAFSGNHPNIASLVLQSDGKIVVAGSLYGLGGGDYMLARYDNSGVLDGTFGTDGVVNTDISSGSADYAQAAVLQPDGKIVLAGYTNIGSNYLFALARYLTGLNVGTIDFSAINSQVLIYPNPVGQQARLEYSLKEPEAISIRLFDGQGVLLKNILANVQQQPGPYQQQIDLPDNLPAGIYVVVLSSPRGKLSVKIVK